MFRHALALALKQTPERRQRREWKRPALPGLGGAHLKPHDAGGEVLSLKESRANVPGREAWEVGDARHQPRTLRKPEGGGRDAGGAEDGEGREGEGDKEGREEIGGPGPEA